MRPPSVEHTIQGPMWDRALEGLTQSTYRYGFYQTVRYLLRRYRSMYPNRETPLTLREIVRFTSQITMSFPPSDLVNLELNIPDNPSAAEPTADLEVAFMGLAGHQSPLPNHYAEHILRQRRFKDHSLAEFLNVFNNRLIGLLYKSWEKPRFYIPAERGEPDPLTDSLYSLLGFGAPRLRNALPFPPSILLGHLTRTIRRPVSLDTLSSVLRSYLPDVPSRVIPFAGRWVELELESRTRLSDEPSPPTLGQLLPLGNRVWDVQGQICIEFGPLQAEQIEAFLPGGTKYTQVIELVRVLSGPHIEVDLRLIMPRDTIPLAQLGQGSGFGSQLGRGLWLGKSKTYQQVVIDVQSNRMEARWN